MWRKELTKRIAITLSLAVAILALFEFYLRREVTYVVQRQLTEQKGVLEQTPEFLVTAQNGLRRLLPNAHVTIKNHFTSGLDVAIDTNALGLRHRELANPKPARELRILILGDSTTVMDYLPDDDTYVRKTEVRLRNLFPNQQIEVINAGIGNVGTEEELALLDEIASSVNPDIVVLAYYLNDSRPPWGFSGEIGNYGWLRRHSLVASTVYRVIYQALWGSERRVQFDWIPALEKLPWKSEGAAFQQLVQLARYDWGAAWQPDERQRAEQLLQTFLAKTQNLGAIAVLTIFPSRYQLESSAADFVPQEWFAKFAVAQSVPYLDLLPAFRGIAIAELFYDHCHVTARGSEAIATALTQLLTPLVRSAIEKKSPA